MNNWNLNYISEENLKNHVRKTILKYGEKLKPFNLKEFNSNIVDPIKLLFDKSVYGITWEQIVSNEIFRQRDKSSNNDIGYFHQNIFSYFNGCEVPQAGWDVIYRNPDGIILSDGDTVHTIYVEMKNKHNTMNSSSSAKTYIKMQGQLLDDDDCACFLVEVLAKKSQDIKWSTKIDGKNVSHKKIRRVSIDQFYTLLTGDNEAFYKMCMVLPSVIKDIIDEQAHSLIPSDTAYEGLKFISSLYPDFSEEDAMMMAVYILGFSSYQGFDKILNTIINDSESNNINDGALKHLYTYIDNELQKNIKK